MLTETFRSIAAATRKVIGNWRSMLLLAIVYASLLASLYFFVVVREASLAQVSLTFALAIAAPVLFFVFQTMVVNGPANGVASEAEGLTSASLVRKSLTSFWKLLLITLPLIAVAVLMVYVLGKTQVHFAGNVNEAASELPRRITTLATARDAAKPIDWRATIFSTLRYLAFGLVLPLTAIHLWLATAQKGLGWAIRRVATVLSRAFAPQSVLIYIVGFVIFGVIPYLLLYRTTPTRHAWLELFFLVARLTVVFALTLFGWVITVKALSLISRNPPDASLNET